MDLRIGVGFCYQIIDRLLDVTTPSTARMLGQLASNRDVIEISKEEALKQGFDELANWSIPEYDTLYLIDSHILVCVPKEGGAYA